LQRLPPLDGFETLTNPTFSFGRQSIPFSRHAQGFVHAENKAIFNLIGSWLRHDFGRSHIPSYNKCVRGLLFSATTITQ